MTDIIHADHDALGEHLVYREAGEDDTAVCFESEEYEPLTAKMRDELWREVFSGRIAARTLLRRDHEVIATERDTLRAEVERLTAVAAWLASHDTTEVNRGEFVHDAISAEFKAVRLAAANAAAAEPFRPRTCGTHAHADDLIDGDTSRLPEEER